MITKYTCSKCGKEFSNFGECFNHEKECFTLEEVRQNIMQSVIEVTEEFKDKIKEVAEYDIPTIRTNLYDDGNSATYIDFTLHLVLHNGLDVYIDANGIREIKNYEEIKNYMISTINDKLITSHTGELTSAYESGWLEYMLNGEISVMDILEKFQGKKIEIRVIED